MFFVFLFFYLIYFTFICGLKNIFMGVPNVFIIVSIVFKRFKSKFIKDTGRNVFFIVLI